MVPGTPGSIWDPDEVRDGKSKGKAMGTPFEVVDETTAAELEAAFEEVGEGDGVFGIIDETGIYAPFPLLDYNLTVEMVISEDQGSLQYSIYMENDGDVEIPMMSVRPDLPEGLELIDASSKPLGPVAPGRKVAVSFMVKASFESLTQGVDGTPISGLDTHVLAELKIRNRSAEYHVHVTNTRQWNLRRILIRPSLPYGVVPLDEETTIPVLKAGEAETIEFRLITKDEVDKQVRHQKRLTVHSLYTPSPPRRRHKGFPRSHTDEELEEMVRRLEELESAILIPEEDRLEDILEMDGFEYGIEVMEVYECLEHDGLEEGFLLIEIEVEEPRPMGEPQEYVEAYEEEFVVIDLEEFASIRPLGLEPTITDEIDIEPMEIDF
jgi:hypothetical protein